MRKLVYKKCIVCRKPFIVYEGKGRVPRGKKEYPVRQINTFTCCAECSKICHKNRYKMQ